MDKHEKNTILTTQDDERMEQPHYAPGRKVRMESKERRTKHHLLPQLSLRKKTSLGEGSNRVGGKPTTKRVSL